MITRKQYKSAKDVKMYFDHSLAESDYHTQKGQIVGQWNGKGAALLGLSKEVERDDFRKLADNIHPESDKRLTSRTNKNRTVAEDFTFSVPKSVSIQFAITDDQDIVKATNDAVQKTMEEIEKDAMTRVRLDGKYENRPSQNLTWASFIHDDTRPMEQIVNGNKVAVPDPQLHVHNVIVNATFDEEEERWKAVNFRNCVANLPYYRQVFGNHLAQNLQEAGYAVERTSYNFEIAGYDRSTIETFSNRQRIIEETARKKNITDPAAKAALGAKTRSSKRKGLSKEELREYRLSLLSEQELEVINQAKGSVNRASEKNKGLPSAREAVDFAIEHGLSRKSVIEHKELLKHALKYGKVSTTKEQLEFAIAGHEYLRSKETEEGRIYTNVEAHIEEKKLIAESKNGRGKFKPINPNYEIKNQQLTEEQKMAVQHALNSKDFITLITGRAGAGKTWSVKEIAQGIEEAQVNFGAFAPSSQASRKVQREDGFEDATTIAELLVNEKRQDQIANGVIWLDEAGMVGNATLNRVIGLAKKRNARILMTGDTRQHNSVERGDAMRIIEQHGGIETASISQNKRQKSEAYREAVVALSNGQMVDGYTSLDNMGAIKEGEDMDVVKENVADEYIQSIKSQDRTIVIAVTHSQGEAVTQSIREKLKEENRLEQEDKSFVTFRNKSLDDAQKKDDVNYEVGDLVEFHQNVSGGFKRGSRYEVSGFDKEGNVLVKQNDSPVKTDGFLLPKEAVNKYSIYQKTDLPIAKGDQIRITKSGFTLDKHRLENGDLMSVKGFTEEGNIQLHTGRKTITVDKDFGHFTHGYAITSQASQGKTVNKVIVMQGSVSGKASSQEQFYVSASRGRFEISVHTDDKELLLHNIQRSSKRMTAMEVAGEIDKNKELKKEFTKASTPTPTKSASKVNKDWQQTQADPANDNTEPIEPPTPPPPSPGIEPDAPSI